MSHASFAAALDSAAPTIQNPFHFLAVVYSYLSSLAGGFVDSPEERAAIEATVMTAYDRLTLSLMATNPMVAGLFVAFRTTVKDGLDKILLALAPVPAPMPGPLPIQIPVGAAP